MRIGKQLTEAMLLNNKERRRDGKERFNSLLAQLEKTMVADAEARGQGAQAREAIHAKTKQFDHFASVGLKMEYTYKEAMESIVECMDGLDEIDNAILTSKDMHAIREANITYYIWGIPFTIRTTIQTSS